VAIRLPKNPTVEDRKLYILSAKAAGFRIIGFYFAVPIEAALQRNAKRGDGERIPEAGLRAIRNRLELPSFGEVFDDLSFVRPRPGGIFIVEAWKNEV
jgi:hypothetical protein